MGGGFGPEGAVTGMLVATALNMLTTSTSISTVICLQTHTAELFLHSSSQTPDQLRWHLSPVFSILRQQTAAGVATQSSEGDVVDRLAKLADLLEKGLITDDEFAALKAGLLKSLG